MGGALADWAMTCSELLGWDDDHSLSLLAGLVDMATEPARALAEVAALKGTAEFDVAFDQWLNMYGCRPLHYEIAEPNLEERPKLIHALIDDLRRRGSTVEPTRTELGRRRNEAVEEGRRALSDPDARDRFERALARVVLAYPVREDNEFLTVSVPLGLLRRAALETGRRLVANGQIAERQDVFFLELEEAVELLVSGAPAHEVVDRRKGERAWILAHPGPASYGKPIPPPPLDALPPLARRSMEMFLWYTDRLMGSPASPGSTDTDTVRGVAAARGRYTGRARIVLAESEFDRVEPGDVLVCPVTSPVWSVLFTRIGALVTNAGGTLSHPAIIAREYGIPAVVDTRNATTTITDGQIVLVDGDLGTVTVLS